MGRRLITHEMDARIAALRRGRATYQAIADELGIHPQSVYSSLKRQKLLHAKSAPITVSVEVAAYHAGLFDGEGTISIRNHPRGWHWLRVALVNAHRPTMDRVKETFGGSVYTRPAAEIYGHPEWQDVHVWETTARIAERFLRVVLPYLSVKREEALIGLEFADRCMYRSRKLLLTDEERALRESFRKRLSGRGKARLLNLAG